MKKTWLFETHWLTRTLVAGVVFAMLGLALMANPKPAAAQQTACFTNHIVQPGQYIAQIARIYNVTPQAIMAANPQVTNPNLIFPGQVLVIPLCGAVPPIIILTPTPAPPPPTVPPGTGGIPGVCRYYHYVMPGQTMLGIARLYNANPFAIAQANGIFNLNLIFAGTTLCIP